MDTILTIKAAKIINWKAYNFFQQNYNWQHESTDLIPILGWWHYVALGWFTDVKALYTVTSCLTTFFQKKNVGHLVLKWDLLLSYEPHIWQSVCGIPPCHVACNCSRARPLFSHFVLTVTARFPEMSANQSITTWCPSSKNENKISWKSLWKAENISFNWCFPSIPRQIKSTTKKNMHKMPVIWSILCGQYVLYFGIYEGRLQSLWTHLITLS